MRVSPILVALLPPPSAAAHDLRCLRRSRYYDRSTQSPDRRRTEIKFAGVRGDGLSRFRAVAIFIPICQAVGLGSQLPAPSPTTDHFTSTSPHIAGLPRVLGSLMIFRGTSPSHDLTHPTIHRVLDSGYLG